jgi:plastocyanin
MTCTQRIVTAGIAGLLLAACGSSSTSPSNVPSPGNTPQVTTNTITITSSGVSPRNVQIALGSRVLFVNNDSRSHNMTSDPHPDHTDCPDINQVGFLAAGQSRETGNMVTARTCGFHDHDMPSQGLLTGQIVIK